MRVFGLGFLLLASALAGPAWGENCALAIESNDALAFNLKELRAKATCAQVTVTLKHTGKSPAALMGHNWVLARTADFEALAAAGGAAGAPTYLPKDDARVLAATKIIGGGEQTAVTFDVSRLTPGESYTYFCSFPPHWVLMHGKLIIE